MSRKRIILALVAVALLVAGFFSMDGVFLQGKLSGGNFSSLNDSQKQKYWSLMRSECMEMLDAKDHASYRQCALNVMEEAQNYQPGTQAWCNDSDGLDYYTKGVVKTDIHPDGIEDYTYTFSSGETYVMEGACKDGKYLYYQKNCAELGDYKAEDGVCKAKSNLSGVLDTLVVVDTDYFDISDSEVEEFFKTAEDLWMKPKTGIGFNLTKIVHTSFTEECPQQNGECNVKLWIMNENFQYYDKELPEYIVVLTKTGASALFGGHVVDYFSYHWMNPELEGYYNPNSEHDFCTEFPVAEFPVVGADSAVPLVVIDYGHKYGACGYDANKENIISDVSINGQCKNQAGLTCVMNNGYQMCPNLLNEFFAQNPSYFSASIMVHELLHTYGEYANLDHFGTSVCLDNMGEKMQELEDAGVSEPFYELVEEYASMCPNTWESFKNSQKEC